MERKETKKERLERRKIADKRRRSLQEAHIKYVEDLELENQCLREEMVAMFKDCLNHTIDAAIEELRRKEEGAKNGND